MAEIFLFTLLPATTLPDFWVRQLEDRASAQSLAEVLLVRTAELIPTSCAAVPPGATGVWVVQYMPWHQRPAYRVRI